MSKQRGLFDGDAAKEIGIATVTAAHTPEWYKERFYAAVREMARGKEFTSETITAIIGLSPTHPNAVGALMNGVAKTELACKAGRRVKAQRVNQHSAMLEVWIRT